MTGQAREEEEEEVDQITVRKLVYMAGCCVKGNDSVDTSEE